MKRPVLPVYYYHDHFVEMLTFVSETYASVLTAPHRAFVAAFQGLSKDAQCLLIRMINRRGRIFRADALRYAEILDAAAALGQLRRAGFVRSLEADDYAAFVLCHSRESLLRVAKTAGIQNFRASWSKAKLVAHCLANVAFATLHACCDGDRFVSLGDMEPVEFLLFLYFGKMEDDLKSFALRDLGILRTNPNAVLGARFADEDEARACFHYSRLLNRFDPQCAATCRDAAHSVLHGPACGTDYAVDLRGKAAHRIGLHFEKSGDRMRASQIYRIGASSECNERLVRLLYGAGDRSGADELLRRMIDDPASDDEFMFASDFHARKFGGQKVGSCTALLRAGIAITVDDTWRGNPEAGVASVLRRQGYTVHHTENTIWRCLFGLLFWDQLFKSGQLHSGFDWMPQCLKTRTFARLFSDQVDEKLAAVNAGGGVPLILQTMAQHWGQPNGLFGWDWIDIEALRTLLDARPVGVVGVLRLMCEDYRGMSDGFPDLMIEKDGIIGFVEVKAEGDAIRRNQLTRLRQLGDEGIDARIARVEFRFDPEQDYVVVDIETTGSWSNGDRITEIGAVKIRNHEVVGEWHSLINPQRQIPANITRLTGITNDMVRDAPLFAEVADGFMTFMGDGVFVAHSVNFDYGFISREYERLQRRFRFPKLCTCASMRRRYPGHKSYGLGALCRTYGIELENHHRALCDARATAHLLNLINAKREERADPAVIAA